MCAPMHFVVINVHKIFTISAHEGHQVTISMTSPSSFALIFYAFFLLFFFPFSLNTLTYNTSILVNSNKVNNASDHRFVIFCLFYLFSFDLRLFFDLCETHDCFRCFAVIYTYFKCLCHGRSCIEYKQQNACFSSLCDLMYF